MFCWPGQSHLSGFYFGFFMSDSEPQSQITHLIKLIDDRDEFVRSRVRGKLIELGADAIPFLEMAAREENASLRTRAREIIKAFFPIQLGEKFRQLATSAPMGYFDLEEGMLLLMQYGYPESQPQEIRETLDGYAREISSRIPPQASPKTIVVELTRFLFVEKRFKGNEKNYSDPDNSYFNKVLERKTGIPITLSALCILVGSRLGQPIVGVGLPGHYIAKFDAAKDPIFFDPFHGGRRLIREDCIGLITRLGHHFEEHHLAKATNQETLVRMMNNLIHAYNQSQETEIAGQLADFTRILMKPNEDNPVKPV